MHCNEFSSAKPLFSLDFLSLFFLSFLFQLLFNFSNPLDPLKPSISSCSFPFFILRSFSSFMFSSPQDFIPITLFSLFSLLSLFFFLLLSYMSTFYNLFFLINKTKPILILTNMENIYLREKSFRVNIRIDLLHLFRTNKFLDITDV